MTRADTAWEAVAGLAAELVDAWGAWAPMMTSDGSRVAYVSDRTGSPQLWVQDVPGASAELPEARLVALGPDPVVSVGGSPDDAWISCSVATGGGVRTEVWVVRPDGGDAHLVAGGAGAGHAVLGPWARQGHGLVVTMCGDDPATPHGCLLIDPATGASEQVATGRLIQMLDLTGDGRFALLRDGTRGAQFCRLVDRSADTDYAILPYPETGSADLGLLRPALPAQDGEAQTAMAAYLVTDAGVPRRELVAVGVHDDGRRSAAGTLAARDDADLEFADARVTYVQAGMVLLDPASGKRTPCPGLPGDVVSGAVLSRDGASAVLAVESPVAPRRLWRLDCGSLDWRPVTPVSLPTAQALVRPELIHFDAHDGLPLSGWLYRARTSAPPTDSDFRLSPGMISLHGGPEAQERPVFTPQHQVLATAGITVLAPNIRGSSGFGRAFVHADDRYGRFDAIRDVADCARILASRGYADPTRIAVTGRSYGGYATLLALVRHAPAFAAGVDICGMSDLLSFYRDTEPWIGSAAITKYGDPTRDAPLLAELSPLHQAAAITVPLLVVHGELDTNVPRNEAVQIVRRLRELERPVEYLELDGEGHEYRRRDSRLTLLRTLTEFLARVLRAA